jgi:hypothetical protein
MSTITFSAEVISSERAEALSYHVNPSGQAQIVVVPGATLCGRKLDLRTSYALPKTRDNLALANRLAKAIRSGAAYSAAVVRTDVKGAEYLSTTPKFFMRTLARDLEEMGF